MPALFKTMNFDSADYARALELAADNAWMMSIKYDGYGVFAGCKDGVPFVHAAKTGETLKKNINPAILRNLKAIWDASGEFNFRFRGELDFKGAGVAEGVIRVWEETSFPHETALTRYEAMKRKIFNWYDAMRWEGELPSLDADLQYYRDRGRYVLPTVQFSTTESKQAVLAMAMQDSEEGVVFTFKSGLYVPDKRVSHVVKFKFVETADLRIASWKVTTEKDVNGYAHGVAVIEAANGPMWAPVGQVHIRSDIVSTLQNWDVARPGQPYPPLEVAYLYYTGGCVVQPIAKTLRMDKVKQVRELAYTDVKYLRRSNRFQTEVA